MSHTSAIDADGLTKRYGETLAVDDFDLAIGEGSVYGFLGPNGAGKTTTMRLLTGLTRPTAGTATVAGIPIDDRDRLAGTVGYLPAEPPVFDELTGWEQLRHVARLHGLDDAAGDDRIERLLDRFDLLGDADRRIAGYSTGMRKKVGLIATLLHDPEIVLLDEPTSGLDPRAARTVREMLVDLADREMTVLLSTHILSIVEAVADTVVVIDEGRLVAEGPPADLTARATEDGDLESAFLAITDDRAHAGERNV